MVAPMDSAAAAAMRKTSIEIAVPVIRPIVSKSQMKKASIEIL
jgi:hypothetical protein